MEKGGDRWSKPHVSTPSLHSLFELRDCIANGCVMLDMEETKWVKIVGNGSDKNMLYAEAVVIVCFAWRKDYCDPGNDPNVGRKSSR